MDFLVLQPLPFALELVSLKHTRSVPMPMKKRLLARRIAVAERFGPSLPFIPVLDKERSSEPAPLLPFVDATFSIHDLPRLDQLKEVVQLNPDVQRILQRGDPGEVQLIDRNQVA
jgi:hypothetical protein